LTTNKQCDPESASSIFSNRILEPKTVLVTLDLTHQVLGTSSVLELIHFGRASESRTSTSTARKLFHEIITYFSTTYVSQFAMHSGPPLHDPVAVAAIFCPLLFDDNNGERFKVTVIREDTDDREEADDVRSSLREQGKGNQCGRTVLELLPKGEEGVRVPRGVDVGVFWNLIEFGLESGEKRQ
jgi:uridine nucleosidase